jgi:toxin ParE1/3/4
MSQYNFAPQAEEDLQDIQDYLAAHSPPAAARLTNAIERRCQLLAQQPMIGRDRSDLSPWLRSVVVGKYLLFYRPLPGGGVEVVRVLHGARNIDPSLFAP